MTQLGPVCGRGRSADVHEWGDTTLLKLFSREWLQHEVIYEFQVSHAAHAAGIATPRPHKMIEYNGRRGIVFDRVVGHTLTHVLFRRPWRARSLLRQFAELHRDIHARCGRPLRDQHDYLIPMIAQNSARDNVDRLKWIHQIGQYKDNTLCHNDFHPGNILVTPDGLSVVDWCKGACGHAVLDVTITAIKLGRAIGVPMALRDGWLSGVLGTVAQDTYLKAYFGPDANCRTNVKQLMPAVEAALARTV